MDNISRLYREQYIAAREFAVKGESDKSLDILWDLQLQSDLSHLRRAMVKLLIASQIDIQEHPDVKKFPNEALELVARIRREARYNTADPKEGTALAAIEKHARETLTNIDKELADLQGRSQELPNRSRGSAAGQTSVASAGSAVKGAPDSGSKRVREALFDGDLSSWIRRVWHAMSIEVCSIRSRSKQTEEGRALAKARILFLCLMESLLASGPHTR